MSLPPIRQIKREDVPGAPPWFGVFLDALNRFMDATFKLFDGGLQFGKNIAARVVPVTFRTLSTYSSGDFDEVRVQSGIARKARSVTIQRVETIADNEPVFTGSAFLDWKQDGDQIVVRHVAGLANSTTYRVTLLIW